MGEFADMAIDMMLAEDEYALNSDGYDEYGEPVWSPFGRWFGPRPKTCRYCGQSGLFWGRNEETGRWQLEDYDADEDEWFRHVCKMKNAWKSSIDTGISSTQRQNT